MRDTGQKKPSLHAPSGDSVLFKGAPFPQNMLTAMSLELIQVLTLKSNWSPNSPTLFKQTQRVQLTHCEGAPWSEEPYPSGGDNDSCSETKSPGLPPAQRPAQFLQPHSQIMSLPSEDSSGDAQEKDVQRNHMKSFIPSNFTGGSPVQSSASHWLAAGWRQMGVGQQRRKTKLGTLTQGSPFCFL